MKLVLKKIYQYIPFKRQVFALIRSTINLPEKVYQHFHFRGDFKIKMGDQFFKMHHTGHIEENKLFWGGIDNGWEKTSLMLWRKLSETSDVILDIGANTGVYSLVAKTINKNSQVYAFEPLPKVVEYLEYNNKINNYDINIIPKAVSNYTGEANVYLRVGEEFAYSVTVNKSLLSNQTKQEKLIVPTITLRDFILHNDISEINLVKIDVETHESEVIEGLGEYIDVFRPDFILEVWDDNSAKKLNNLFYDKKYLFFDIDDKNNVVSQKKEISTSSYWNFLVCKPESASKIGLI